MYKVIIFTECNGIEGWGRDAGAYTVASSLRKSGVPTLVVDFFSSFDFELWKKVIDKYVDQDTSLLGFSSTHFSTLLPDQWNDHFKDDERTRVSMSWNTYFPFPPEQMNEWIQYAKNKNSKIQVVVGGQKVAQKVSLRDNYPFVDIWIGGMAEKSILGILAPVLKDENIPKYIRSELDYGAISEDEFSRSFIDWQKTDFIFQDEALPLEIARGCPFQCSFCDYQKKTKGSWIKDFTHLRDHLISNWERFGTTRYMITDFLVNEDIKKMTSFWKMTQTLPFKVKWTGFARLDLLEAYPEMVDLIYESGAVSIQWGIESINADVGPRIGKNTSRDFIEKLLDKCKAKWNDSVVMGSGFIVGLPGDTISSTNELFSWLVDQEWLNGWEITPLFIGGYDKKREYTIDYSKIQREPETFGYDTKMEKRNNTYIEKWMMGELTKEIAIELIEDFQRTQGWKTRLVPTFHGYHRMHNLGFNDNEIKKMTRLDDQWVLDMSQAYKRLSQLYFNQLV